MPWIEKHRPKTFSEIKGQDEAVEKIKKFIQSFPSKKKALLLHGPPGVGKTTLAQVAAKETNFEIFELNASDFRSKTSLQERLKPAIEQRSLSNKSKLILVDEVDGISEVDRGGISELISLIAETPYPIILTANDAWEKKLQPLRTKLELLQLKDINYAVIRQVLLDILKKENLLIDEDIVTKISLKAKGDLRAAINDLQAISKIEDASKIIFDERNREVDIFNALKKIFKDKPSEETLGVFESVNMPIDEIILWVEENIPAEYQGEELARAYEKLSRTDIFKRRIYRQQYWRFLVYENILLSYGISASKSKNHISKGFTAYKKPSRILKIWLNNQRTIKKKSIAQKYSRYVHVGEKRAMKEFPIIKMIINSNPQIQKELKLSEEELEYLKE
jgi:replication factor C large subunit